MLLTHLGEDEASRAIDAAIREGLRGGRIKGVEAGIQPTNEVAEVVAKAVAG
jgi:isocitrate/isopropylmalate dehydrogenase